MGIMSGAQEEDGMVFTVFTDCCMSYGTAIGHTGAVN
jgi:hypothetical protein